jgi:hypothetical protein
VVVVTRKLLLLDLSLHSVGLLVDQADPAASEVVSEEASMVDEAEAVSEVASKTEEVMEAVVEVASASAEASMEVIVVGMEMVHPLPMLQLDQVAEATLVMAASEAEEVSQALQTAMAHLVVGMIHAEVDAHMMTDQVDIVVVTEVIMTAMDREEVEVEATWSR